MITQDFLTELELSLIKSYTRASKKGLPKAPMSSDIVNAARAREDFINDFMNTFHEQKPVLEREIKRGGHNDPSKMLEKVNREVEAKVRSAIFQNKIESAAFQKVVRDLKVDIRSVFYEKYLSK